MTMFERINGARRLALQLRLPSLQKQQRRRRHHHHHHHRFLTLLVLDSASALDCALDCAGMLVPKGQENEWIYCSEGGQWQLLASCSAARLLLVSRRCIEDFLHEENYEEVFVDDWGLNPPRGSCRTNVRENGKKKSSRCKSEKKSTYKHTEKRKIFLLKGQLSTSRKVKVDQTKSENVLNKRCLDMTVSERDKEKISENECLLCEDRTLLPDILKRKKRPKKRDMIFCEEQDDYLKEALAPLMSAFAPKSSPRMIVPFVSYEDDVVQRVIVEEAFSPLIGQMVVEDVEICLNERATSCKPETTFRRRLRFKRMPNLIQTEVPLVRLSTERTEIMKENTLCSRSDLSCLPTVAQRIDRVNCIHKESIRVSKRTSGSEKADKPSSEELPSLLDRKLCEMRVDLGRLVHIYLPPIVAGLVLVAPCLEACIKNAKRAKVLAVGIGGGALPLFLHHHFQFDIHAVDIDQTVVALARRHFGLVEDDHLQVTVGDGLRVLSGIAERSIKIHSAPKEPIRARQEVCINSSGDSPIDNDKLEEAISSGRSIGDNCSIKVGLGQVSFENSSISRNFVDIASLNGCSSFHKSNKNGLDFPEKSSDIGTMNTQGASTNLKPLDLLLNTQEKADQTKKACDKEDPRLHVIIIDVDADNATFGLNSPHQTFLEKKLLLAVRMALHDGGMLAMNVLPSREITYASVINALQEVFEDVYEIKVGAGDNYVVFALPAPVDNLDHNSVIGIQVQSLVKENLIGQLQKARYTTNHHFQDDLVS